MNKKLSQLLSKYVRSERRIKASQLSEKIGITHAALNKWIAGNVANPNCEKVLKCAQALGLTSIQQLELLTAANCKDYIPPVTPPEPLPVVGKAISHPCQFFGREDVLSRIYNAWRNNSLQQNIAIIGPRHAGKTSLLHYLINISKVPRQQLRPEQPKKWNNWLPTDFQFALIDFKDQTFNTPERVMQAVLQQIKAESVEENCNAFIFSDKLKQQTKPTVILLDELDTGLEIGQLDRGFWQQLRHLASIYPQIGLVITTHDKDKITQYQVQSSPFFGIFTTIELEAFTEDEANEMLAYSPIPFEQADKDWILKESRCWPVLLQILSNERLFALQTQQQDESWKQKGLKQLQDYQYLFQSEKN
jgi:transcriptional regulator with XRE-family HTH domain